MAKSIEIERIAEALRKQGQSEFDLLIGIPQWLDKGRLRKDQFGSITQRQRS